MCEEASQEEVSFSWSFFPSLGEALSGFLELFWGRLSRCLSSQNWTGAWRYTWQCSLFSSS